MTSNEMMNWWGIGWTCIIRRAEMGEMGQNKDTLRNCLTVLTITNNLISKKLHPKSYLFLSAAITEHPINKRG